MVPAWLFEEWGAFKFYDLFGWEGYWLFILDELWTPLVYLVLPLLIPSIYLVLWVSSGSEMQLM